MIQKIYRIMLRFTQLDLVFVRIHSAFTKVDPDSHCEDFRMTLSDTINSENYVKSSHGKTLDLFSIRRGPPKSGGGLFVYTCLTSAVDEADKTNSSGPKRRASLVITIT